MRLVTLATALIVCSLVAGCAAIPVTTWIAAGGAGVAAGGLALSGIHDCKQDGACKAIPLPP